jgi:hypothetical protein
MLPSMTVDCFTLISTLQYSKCKDKNQYPPDDCRVILPSFLLAEYSTFGALQTRMEDCMMTQKPEKRMKPGIAMATVERSMLGQKTPAFRDLVAAVQTAEQIGLDSFWLADHLPEEKKP